MEFEEPQICYTNKVLCGDCHRCLKTCPVDAISVVNSQASIKPELCICCGMCVRECPLGAKQYKKDWVLVMEDIDSPDVKVAFSIDDTFSVFYEKNASKIPTALKELGAFYYSELSIAAEKYYDAAENLGKKKNGTNFLPTCFSLVNYVEKYETDKLDNIIKYPSPMVLHGAYIKKIKKADRVIYVGPCLAKKAEAQRYDEIDYVLTFEELSELFKQKNIDLNSLEPSDFSEYPTRKSRGLFVRNTQNCVEENDLFLTGFGDAKYALEQDMGTKSLEAMICKHGCANGPASRKDKDRIHKKLKFIEYEKKAAVSDKSVKIDFKVPELVLMPQDVSVSYNKSELKLSGIMGDLGKVSNGVFLNCGACGYTSCREAAVAVLNGMADMDICVQRTKRRYKSLSGTVLQTSPNAIVIVDNNFSILNINPSFKKMFKCGDMILGKPISTVLDSEIYQRIQNGEGEMFDRIIKLERYNLICHAIIYSVPKEDCMIGIYIDITKSEKDREKLTALKSTTANKAKELLEYQFKMMEDIVEYIGESSAKSEELVDNLLEIISNEE